MTTVEWTNRKGDHPPQQAPRLRFGLRRRPTAHETQALEYIEEGEPLKLSLPNRRVSTYVQSHFYLDEFSQSEPLDENPRPHTQLDAQLEDDYVADDGYQGRPFPQLRRPSFLGPDLDTDSEDGPDETFRRDGFPPPAQPSSSASGRTGKAVLVQQPMVSRLNSSENDAPMASSRRSRDHKFSRAPSRSRGCLRSEPNLTAEQRQRQLRPRSKAARSAARALLQRASSEGTVPRARSRLTAARTNDNRRRASVRKANTMDQVTNAVNDELISRSI